MSVIARVAVVALLLLCGSCECVDEYGTRYTCNCTATCQGMPVSSYSTTCAESSSGANAAGVAACMAELSSCPEPVTCSCSCSGGGECLLSSGNCR